MEFSSTSEDGLGSVSVRLVASSSFTAMVLQASRTSVFAAQKIRTPLTFCKREVPEVL